MHIVSRICWIFAAPCLQFTCLDNICLDKYIIMLYHSNMTNDELQTHGLYDHTGYWLRRLSNLVHHTFELALAEYGVTVAQWNALVAIYNGDATTPFDLARFIDIDSGAVTRLVDRLVEKQLLVRVPATEDRRSIRLELTAKGRELVPQLVQRADTNDQQFFGALTSAEHRQLKALMNKLLSANGIAVPDQWRTS